jgi:hypothetical protein
VFILQVREKPPLTSENNKCFGCSAKLEAGFFSRAGLFCHYTGQYYCTRCHTNEKSIIPARLIHFWDKKEYQVCVASKEHIERNKFKPVLKLSQLNALLFTWVPILDQIRNIRRQLPTMGDFLKTCHDGWKLISLLGDRSYMLDSSFAYSLADLVNAKDVLTLLYQISEKYILHITKTCETCKGKGFICELCNSEKPIFSFQLHTVLKCMKCSTLFHKECAKTKLIDSQFQCPKCQRRERKKKSSS